MVPLARRAGRSALGQVPPRSDAGSMKILTAPDGSEGAAIARDLVVALPLPESAEVHLVAAYQVPTDWAPELGAGMAWIDDAETAMQDTLHDTLGTMASPLVAAGEPEEVVRNASAVAAASVRMTRGGARHPPAADGPDGTSGMTMRPSCAKAPRS